MNLQYISDSQGKTTGVFIPIKEWKDLMEKFKGINLEVDTVPEWQKSIVQERLEKYHTGQSKPQNAKDALDDIESQL